MLEFCSFNIALKREGEKEKREKEKKNYYIWSPIQPLTPPNRA